MDPFFIIGILVLTILIMMVASTWFLYKRIKGSMGVLLLGGLGFFIAEVMLREPTLPLLLKLVDSPFFAAILFGGSAAVVETISRYLIIRFGLSERLSWTSGAIAGVGFGFCEIFFAFVLTYGIGILLHMAGVDTAILVQFSMEEMDTYVYFLSFLERIFMLCIQIAWMIMITIGVKKKQEKVYTVSVFSLQFLFLSTTMYLQYLGVDLLFVEVFIALGAVGAILYTMRTFRQYADQLSIPEDAGEKAVREGY